MSEQIPMSVHLDHLETLTYEYINNKLEAAGHRLRAVPGSFSLHPTEGAVVLLEELPEEKPPVLSLDDLLDQAPAPAARQEPPPQAQPAGDPAVRYAAAVAAELGRMLPEDEEPPPLVQASTAQRREDGVTLYNSPPQVSAVDREAFRRLQAAGIVDSHLTPELLASQTRGDVKDGVGEVLTNGYVQGSTPPAGHDDDPHRNARWRRPSTSIADIVSGALKQRT